jgi:hypothetical protein
LFALSGCSKFIFSKTAKWIKKLPKYLNT